MCGLSRHKKICRVNSIMTTGHSERMFSGMSTLRRQATLSVSVAGKALISGCWGQRHTLHFTVCSVVSIRNMRCFCSKTWIMTGNFLNHSFEILPQFLSIFFTPLRILWWAGYVESCSEWEGWVLKNLFPNTLPPPPRVKGKYVNNVV